MIDNLTETIQAILSKPEFNEVNYFIDSNKLQYLSNSFVVNQKESENVKFEVLKLASEGKKINLFINSKM